MRDFFQVYLKAGFEVTQADSALALSPHDSDGTGH